MCVVSGVSYGQNTITISDFECEVTAFISPAGIADVTISGTIRANIAIENVYGWLTLNGKRIGPGGIPVVDIPGLPATGGKSLGDFSAGETKSFSITVANVLVHDGDSCGYYFGWEEAGSPPADPGTEPPTNTEPPENIDDTTPVPSGASPGVCQVGDILAPGESCTDPAVGEFSVNADGSVNFRGARVEAGGVSWNNFAATRHGTSWEITSVTPSDNPQTPRGGPQVLIVDPDSPPIYWTDYGTDKIQRVNLDGSNVEDLITRNLNYPWGIALDIADDKIYWTDRSPSRIRRADLDGSNVEDLITQGLNSPVHITLDIAGGKMYWTDPGTGKIQRANLDGSNVEDLVTRGLDDPVYIALDIAGGKMYWTDSGTGKIQRANLDGSNIEDLVTSGLDGPWGIALDVAASKMYWTDWSTEKIQCASLDGSNIEDLITRSSLDTPGDIALDVAGGKMYWTHTDWNPTTQEFSNGKIQRANLDGTNIQTVITGLDVPDGIALALPPQSTPSAPDLVIETVEAVPATVAPGETFRLYATLKNQGLTESTATTLRYYRSVDAVISTSDTQLASAKRDTLAPGATGRRYLTVTAPTTPGTYYYGACVDSVSNESNTDNNCSVAVAVTVTGASVVAEDVNGDGVVDVQDLVFVAQRYGQTGTTPADVNDDGVVDINDLILVAAALDAEDAAAPSLYADVLDVFSVKDVKSWLSEAQQRDLTDPRVQRGILFLEQLLAFMVPKETLLLANYPNPFNPETWIPYQLSKPADVTLMIYTVDGQMVRRLALGHQRAGMYQNRNRAAYWDGKNAFGEPVASGLYFYTLTAGDFTATRKMLIRK